MGYAVWSRSIRQTSSSSLPTCKILKSPSVKPKRHKTDSYSGAHDQCSQADGYLNNKHV